VSIRWDSEWDYEGRCWLIPRRVDDLPVDGWHYLAFAVRPYPPDPGLLMAVAITHVDGDRVHLDVVREGLSIDDCDALLHQYRINRIAGHIDDEGDDDAVYHAIMGATTLAVDWARARS
jgi:hypothetical protein